MAQRGAERERKIEPDFAWPGSASCSTLPGLHCLPPASLSPPGSSSSRPLHLIPRQPNANVWLMRRTHTRSRARATYVSPRRRRPPPAPPRRPYSPPLLILLFFPLRRPRTQCATSRCLGVTVMTYSHMHVMSDIVPPSSSSYAATSLSPIVPYYQPTVYSDTDTNTVP